MCLAWDSWASQDQSFLKDEILDVPGLPRSSWGILLCFPNIVPALFLESLNTHPGFTLEPFELPGSADWALEDSGLGGFGLGSADLPLEDPGLRGLGLASADLPLEDPGLGLEPLPEKKFPCGLNC